MIKHRFITLLVMLYISSSVCSGTNSINPIAPLTISYGSLDKLKVEPDTVEQEPVSNQQVSATQKTSKTDQPVNSGKMKEPNKYRKADNAYKANTKSEGQEMNASKDTTIAVVDTACQGDISGDTNSQNDSKQQWKEAYQTLLKPLVDKYGLLVLCGVVILIVIIAMTKNRKKKKALQPTFANSPVVESQPQQSDIVVRRKTTTILKKQNLGDVLHNDNYLKVDCKDFCSDSAVRRMYIKNTCIKEIYNMYADDLRNPDNPKEDGCMVLGRWVHDDETDEYYVSLEHVVMPGDDAVFKEYELNFGGKIKLRVAEKLRRLRKDTDLQYDMTCWVHSHPGLGVFFSNSDNTVHMQLKHAMHPKFLTAIVVDILTPKMDMGIFTFKRSDDLTVNSKQDLTRLLSLEKMYEWALESDRSSFKQDNYFDVLSAARERDESCNGIQLSNGAIIDICKIIEEQRTDIVGFGHGYAHTHGIVTDYVVEEVSLKTEVPNNEMLGCLVLGSHLSLPSIQKAITKYADICKFVMFYSTIKESLVSMPVIKGEILMDEAYFSEEKIEDLKIWTRRRR